jgi:hypothetical protein
MASKGFRVNVLTTKPNLWSSSVTVTTATSTWKSRGAFVGAINKVSSDPADVIPGCDVIIVCAPAHVHGAIVKSIGPHLSPNTYVGTIFAQGGFDWIVRDALGSEHLHKAKAIFGLQNIPWICKLTTYGKEARILGPKERLKAVSSPVEHTSEILAIIEQMYDIPTVALPNFLCLTLTPSNQIIHPARYFAIFKDYTPGRTYTKDEIKAREGMTLYEDFDPLSSEILSKLDNELQTIKICLVRRFPQLDLSAILPIKDRITTTYGEAVADDSSLLSVMRTNKGYVGCATPLEDCGEGRYRPAAKSRLFWEDIPYGLCILKHLAEMLNNLPTPTINKMIFWHQEFMGKEFLRKNGTLNPLAMMETGCPGRYGLHRIEDVVAGSIPTQMLNYVNNNLPSSKL